MPSLTPLHYCRVIYGEPDTTGKRSRLYAMGVSHRQDQSQALYGNGMYITDCNRFVIRKYEHQWYVHGHVLYKDTDSWLTEVGLQGAAFSTRSELLQALDEVLQADNDLP